MPVREWSHGHAHLVLWFAALLSLTGCFNEGKPAPDASITVDTVVEHDTGSAEPDGVATDLTATEQDAAEVKHETSTQGDAGQDQATPGDATPDQTTLVDTSDQTTPDDALLDESTFQDQSTPGDTGLDQNSVLDQTTFQDQTTPGDTGDQITPDDAVQDQATPGDATDQASPGDATDQTSAPETALDAGDDAADASAADQLSQGSCSQFPGAILQGSLTLDETSSNPDPLANYLGLTGNLVLTGTMFSAVDFSSLKCIGGDLILSANGQLTLADFSQLALVGGSIVVQNNGALSGWALPALTLVAGNFTVKQNGAMAALTAPQLHTVNGTLQIQATLTLTTIAFDALSQIGGALGLASSGITDLDGLSQLTSLGGALTIWGHPKLPVEQPCALLSRLVANGYSGGCNCAGNLGANSCDDLGRCGEVVHQGDLAINTLSQLDQAAAITHVTGSVTVEGNLHQLALPELRCVDGDLKLTALPARSASFPQLFEIKGKLEILDGALQNLDGLSGLTTIAGGMSVYSNAMLHQSLVCELRRRTGTTLSSESNLGAESCVEQNINATYGCPAPTLDDSVYVGDVVVANQLDLELLAATTILRGNLTIEAPGMTAIDLSKLRCIAGDLIVAKSPDLVSLDLDALTKVGRNLLLINNSKLSDLSLPALTSVQALYIGSNGALALSLPVLPSVANLELMGNTTLQPPSLPSLTTLTGHLLHTGAAPTTLSLNALTSIGADLRLYTYPISGESMDLCSWPRSQLTSLSLPGLKSIAGSLVLNCSNALDTLTLENLETLGGNLLLKSSSLASLNVPKLITLAELLVRESASLTSITAPSLSSASKIYIHRCEELVALDFTGLQTISGSASEITETGIDQCAKDWFPALQQGWVLIKSNYCPGGCITGWCP